MTYPTDKQIEAACRAHAQALYPGESLDFERMTDEVRGTRLWPAMRAALIAAREAEPPPSMEEFDVAVLRYGLFRGAWTRLVHEREYLSDDYEDEELDALVSAISVERERMEAAAQALRDLFEKAAGR